MRVQLPSFWSLIKDTFLTFRKNWIKYIATVSLSIIAPRYLQQIVFPSLDILKTINPGLAIIIMIFAIFFVLFFPAFGYLYLQINFLLDDKYIEIEDSLTKTIKLLPFAIIVNFLGYFLRLGGTFFFIIPGIIFLYWFFFSELLLIKYNYRGFNALIASRLYVKNNFWQLFAKNIQFFIVSIPLIIPFLVLDHFVKGNIFLLIYMVFYMTIYLLYTFKIFKAFDQQIQGRVEIKRSSKIKYLLIAVTGYILGGTLLIFVVTKYLTALGKLRSDYGIDSFQTPSLDAYSERLNRMTSSRVGNRIYERNISLALTNSSNILNTYYRLNGYFPASLNEVKDGINEEILMLDVNEKITYEKIVNTEGYRLCIIETDTGKQAGCISKKQI